MIIMHYYLRYLRGISLFSFLESPSESFHFETIMLWTGVETCFVFSVLELFLKNQPTSYQHPCYCYLTASPV